MGNLVWIGSGSEWFWQFVQTIVVLVTGIFIYRQLRLQHKQQQLQTDSHTVSCFAVFHDRWNSDLIRCARQSVCKTYRSDSDRVDHAASQVGLFFEELGVYVRTKAVSEELVWELFSFEIEHYWPILENAIRCFRKIQHDDSTFFRNFELLHARMMDMNREKNAYSDKKTTQDLDAFISVELEMIGAEKGVTAD